MSTLSIFNTKDAQSYPAGHILFKAGEEGDLMFVVLEGQVEILLGEKVIETVKSGEIVGEMALIDTRPRSATAIAKTKIKVLPIDADRFQKLIQQAPSFALQVMRILADRLRAMNTQEG